MGERGAKVLAAGLLWWGMVMELGGFATAAEYRHHALIQKSVGFYAVYLPPDYDQKDQQQRTYDVCVMLHGRGRTEVDHVALANALGREGMIYVAPRAPFLYARKVLKKNVLGWTAIPTFPKEWGGKQSPSFPKEETVALQYERLYTDWIADCLADARQRYRVKANRVMVVGHSEGAEFAHQFAMDHSDLVRGYVAYAGYFHEAIMATDASAAFLKKAGVTPFIAHSERDPYVPVATSKQWVAYLQRYGVPHEKMFIRERNHEIASSVIPAIRKFIRTETR